MSALSPAQEQSASSQLKLLRELPSGTRRYFTRFLPLPTFISTAIYDKTPDATKPRVLPLNEILALAFNEFAARDLNAVEDHEDQEDEMPSTGRWCGGFFQHLPNRDMASKVAERHSNSRLK